MHLRCQSCPATEIFQARARFHDCLLLAGYADAVEIAVTQARLVGSMQHPMVIRDFPTAAAALRELAPTYDRLRAALEGRQRSRS